MLTMNAFRERLPQLGISRDTVNATIRELYRAGILARTPGGRGKSRPISTLEAAAILVALCNPTVAGCADLVRAVEALPFCGTHHLSTRRGSSLRTDLGRELESGTEFTSLDAPFLDVLAAVISPGGGGLPFQASDLSIQLTPMPKATIGLGAWQAEDGAICTIEAIYCEPVDGWGSVASVLSNLTSFLGWTRSLMAPSLLLTRLLFEEKVKPPHEGAAADDPEFSISDYAKRLADVPSAR